MPATPPRPSGMLETISTVFRRNRAPCLVLNAVAVTLVLSYYQVPALAGFWEWMGLLKMRWSFAFAFVSTIFAAALLPSFIQWLQGVPPVENRWRRIMLLVLFWGYRGMEIDLFYRLQGCIFGEGADALTLMKKVLLDQFVASPLWFVPTYLIALRWAEFGGSWSRTRQTLNREFWTRTCPTVLVTNWLVWIPALALVYSLPPALQFPLFSVVMCCFILIVTLIAQQPEPKPSVK